MAEFGKRYAVAGAPSRPKLNAAQADVAGALQAAKTGKLPPWTNIGPLRLLLLAFMGVLGFWFLMLPYVSDLIRDHRLAATWQTAYDLGVVDAKCTRFNFLVTTCNAKVVSLAEPDEAPAAVSYMMGFVSGGGEALVPVRSTVNPSAVSIAYAAVTELWNRTLTFLVLSVSFALMPLVAIRALMRGTYKGGAAHRRLIAGLAELPARMERDNQRAAA